MSRRDSRWMPGLVGVAVCGAAVMLGSCTAPSPVVRHLSADHELMTEAGRSAEMLDVVIMLQGKYKESDPQEWRELLDRAGKLNVKAVGVTLERLTAVSGSEAKADRFYEGAKAEAGALKAERDRLMADVAAALPEARQ